MGRIESFGLQSIELVVHLLSFQIFKNIYNLDWYDIGFHHITLILIYQSIFKQGIDGKSCLILDDHEDLLNKEVKKDAKKRKKKHTQTRRKKN